MTTLLPGAKEVFTQGLTFRPSSLADLASKPAAIKTDGFDVFVQLVIAAMAISPSLSFVEFNWEVFIYFLFEVSNKVLIKFSSSFPTRTLSWGLFGPAKDGFISSKSSSKTELKIGSTVFFSRHMP